MSAGNDHPGEKPIGEKLAPDYFPPFFLFNSHLETIFPSLLRRVSLAPYIRERITTPDEDFLDLDWLKTGSRRLAIISHGLEGNSTRSYVKGMAKALTSSGFDVLAWNFRGCSEEMNRQLRFYHSGATEDLDTVVQHAIRQGTYNHISLVGFSLGGNLTLKYLGERTLAPLIRNAVAISVPMDLKSSCEKISQPANRIYSERFLRSLKKKVIIKASMHPELDTTLLKGIRTLTEFDDRYTAPLHGFRDAVDYYDRCSSLRFVDNITAPTLIINTLNDPFLTERSFPAARLKDHQHVRLEILSRGGHVGFTQFNKNGLYWSEQRAVQFLSGA